MAKPGWDAKQWNAEGMTPAREGQYSDRQRHANAPCRPTLESERQRTPQPPPQEGQGSLPPVQALRAAQTRTCWTRQELPSSSPTFLLDTLLYHHTPFLQVSPESFLLQNGTQPLYKVWGTRPTSPWHRLAWCPAHTGHCSVYRRSLPREPCLSGVRLLARRAQV